MPFNDPSQLEDKFETLEAQNLMYVNRLQEFEAQLEEMGEIEKRTRAERDKEYYRQLEYKNSIEDDIEKARVFIGQLRKNSKSSAPTEVNKTGEATIDTGEMIDRLEV